MLQCFRIFWNEIEKKKILWYVFLSERLNDAVRNYSYNS